MTALFSSTKIESQKQGIRMKIEIHQANDTVKASNGNENGTKHAVSFFYSVMMIEHPFKKLKIESHERAFLVFTQNMPILFFSILILSFTFYPTMD